MRRSRSLFRFNDVLLWLSLGRLFRRSDSVCERVSDMTRDPSESVKGYAYLGVRGRRQLLQRNHLCGTVSSIEG